MKPLKLLLFVFIVFPLSGKAQTVITYSYDSAGNRVSRTVSTDVAAIDNNHSIEDQDISKYNLPRSLDEVCICAESLAETIKDVSRDYHFDYCGEYGVCLISLKYLLDDIDTRIVNKLQI